MERKEAIEVVKKNYPHVNVSGSQFETALRTLIPELKESEDEKIRQLLLRFVKYDMSDNYSDDFTPADCVAWLEKQGKNNMGISEATKKKLEDNLNKALEKETPESFNEFLDEQKPVEWSEEDEAIYYGVIETEQYMLDVVNGIKEFSVGNISIKEECTRELNWLKSLKDRVQPQHEWSEEDKETINNLIDYLENELDSSYTDLDKKSFAKEIKLLKSLRPQSTWKPTEQQMKVLNEVINFAADHGTMRWNDYIYNVLKGLREQLKKLREE